MLKLSKNHNIYEIWCEYAAESVYVDHIPSAEELKEICKKNWPDVHHNDVVVERLKPFYTRRLL